MAQGSQLYHGHIQLSDTDRQCYETLEFSTPQHPSEKPERLVLRLLAYALLYEPGLEFRKGGVSQGDAPDLAVRDDVNRILHWIDLGTPALERLRKAARHTPKVSVVTHDGLLARWKRQHGNQLPDFQGNILSLDEELVMTLSRSLPRRFDWQATISGGILYLDNAEESLISPLNHQP
ncbi:YaeQ family protein [Thiolapillus sp.]